MAWFRRARPDYIGDRYQRQTSDYTPGPGVLWLDGSLGWNTATGWDNLRLFNSLPLDTELAVEAGTEPGNPHDDHAVALDIQGARIGYLHRDFAQTMFPLIHQVNLLGFRVLLRGKVTEDPYVAIDLNRSRRTVSSVRRDLELRGTSPGDLLAWLRLPAAVRGTDYFELEWIKTDYQRFYQHQRQPLVIKSEIAIFDCTFSVEPRARSPYASYSAGVAGSPVPPKSGTYVDIVVGRMHVGEVRERSTHHNREVVNRIRGCGGGWALLRHWPDFTDLKVAVPDAGGRHPRSVERFLWRAERREAERQVFERSNLARDLETIDGVSLANCRYRLAELKRAGDMAAARALALKMVEATHASARITGADPVAWVILDAAIVLRKLKESDQEISILGRYVECCSPSDADERVTDRLRKARALAGRS